MSEQANRSVARHDLADHRETSPNEIVDDASVHRGEQPARRLRVVANCGLGISDLGRQPDMRLDVLAVAWIAAGANAAFQRFANSGIERESGVFKFEYGAGALGHVPRVAEQAKSGDIGDGMNRGERLIQDFRRRSVQLSHSGNRHGLVGIGTAGKRNGCTERLGDDEHIADTGSLLAKDPIGMYQTLDSKPEDWFRVADRVPAGDGTTRFGNDLRRRGEYRHDRVAREMLRKRGDVDGNRHSAAHREHVATGVGSRDRTEVRWVIDKRREEIGRTDHGQVVADPVDRGIVERRQPDEQRRIVDGRKIVHQAREQRSTPLRRATAARCPFRQSHCIEVGIEIRHVRQPTVTPMIHIGPYSFTQQDARRTMANLGGLWAALLEGRPSVTATEAGIDLATRLALELSMPPGTTLAALGQTAANLVGPSPTLECVLNDVWFTLESTSQLLRSEGLMPATQTGTAVQLSTSGGGVPKRAVESIEVTHAGVIGDLQRVRVHHGRPWQALCLFADEVIDELRNEGHPIGRGSVGENITVSGLAWADVRPGVVLQIGSVIAHVQAFAEPCATTAAFFVGGDFNRMKIDRGPVSRVYATVLQPGRIDTGDPVVLEPSG